MFHFFVVVEKMFTVYCSKLDFHHYLHYLHSTSISTITDFLDQSIMNMTEKWHIFGKLCCFSVMVPKQWQISNNDFYHYQMIELWRENDTFLENHVLSQRKSPQITKFDKGFLSLPTAMIKSLWILTRNNFCFWKYCAVSLP